ncbi:MAG: hypothetical protein AAFU85_02120 [Planctomycetota bacterium]
MATPVFLEPGEPLTVTLESGRKVDVVSLGMRSKRRAIGILKDMRNHGDDVGLDSVDRLYDLIEEGIKLCIPTATDETFETFNEKSAMDLLQKTLAGQAVGADAAKK